MGALTSVARILTPVLSTAGLPGALIASSAKLAAQSDAREMLRRQQETALAQLKSRQSLDESIAAQNAELEKAKIAADADSANARRTAALRRAVAKQKTLFSAQGLSGGGGSNEAVLLGLYNEADMNAADQVRLDRLKTTALDQSLVAQKQKNVLEASQLAEQQRLSRIIEGYY